MFTNKYTIQYAYDMRKRSETINNAILGAAKDLFVLNGYDSTTIEQIAKNAGVTKRTVYSYYSDKATIPKSDIKDLVDSNLEPDLSKEVKIDSRDGLYKELYVIAKSLNDTFSQDSYVKLLRIVISEINTHSELKSISSIGIVSYSMRKLATIFESTNISGLISMKNIEDAAKVFIGGFLVQFYANGLLESYPNKYKKYTSTELFDYVDKFTKVLFRPKPSLNDDNLNTTDKGVDMGFSDGI